MYLFGGSSKDCENVDMYTLDLNLFKWSVVKTSPKDGLEENMPMTKDEHSSVMLGNSMIIFGGFTFG